MKAFTRSDRVASLIQRNLSEILQRGIKDPRLEMTIITGVKMSQDLKNARIYFSTSGGVRSKEEASQGFQSAMGYIRRTLASQLELRYMPTLSFHYDESFDYGARIDKILDTIKAEENTEEID